MAKSQIEPESQRKEISAYAQLMAGLRFNKKLIYQVFREGMMRESVIYQDILQEGEQKGRQESRQEGELMLILRQLTRRVGTITPEIEAQVRRLSLTQLDGLVKLYLIFRRLQIWMVG
jgi:predicted transposase YdaD